MIFLFDVDGTLTPPRKPMTDKMIEVFGSLVKNHKVFLASGSDLLKIKEQIPYHLLDKCEGIFSCSANQLHIKDELQYENQFIPEERLVAQLEKILEKSSYPHRTGTHIEYRPGMINFSVVGRNATTHERELYFKWDEKHQERKRMAVLLMAMVGGIDIKIGGQISIDIYPTGFDKSQAVSYIKKHYAEESILFFGDRMDEHGNDYSAAQALDDTDRSFAVRNCAKTQNLLEFYLQGGDLWSIDQIVTKLLQKYTMKNYVNP
jgi:phosphomannomutase